MIRLIVFYPNHDIAEIVDRALKTQFSYYYTNPISQNTPHSSKQIHDCDSFAVNQKQFD